MADKTQPGLVEGLHCTYYLVSSAVIYALMRRDRAFLQSPGKYING
jgi:hypothetical protein